MKTNNNNTATKQTMSRNEMCKSFILIKEMMEKKHNLNGYR